MTLGKILGGVYKLHISFAFMLDLISLFLRVPQFLNSVSVQTHIVEDDQQVFQTFNLHLTSLV